VLPRRFVNVTATRTARHPAAATLTVVDDGRGMQRRELARYHDIAASTKARGEGIGFAGVGIKLGLLVSRDVITETRRGATHVATRWHLKSRHRAPWKWIDPPGMTASRGTAVRLTLESQLSALLDAGYLEETVRSHFAPLLDSAFDGILRRAYPSGIAFEIDGRVLDRLPDARAQRAAVAIRLGRRRVPSAVGFFERHTVPQHEDRQGIAISTFGKVIRRGWDWLGLTPANASHISGLIEVPDLAACLTLNKGDFIRTGSRGATYLAYRKAIQEVASRQLGAWGDAPEHDVNPRTERLERDLERVIDDLVDDFPLLRSLVDRRGGGQKRLPMPGRGAERVAGSLFADTPAGHYVIDAGSMAREQPEEKEPLTPAEESAPPEEESPTGEQPQPPMPQSEPPAPPPSSAGANGGRTASGPIGTLSTVPGRRRPARYGLLVQFESRPGDAELGRLVDSTIWINDAHPAYVRAAASRSTGYHLALSVALALAPLAVEPAQEHAFVTQFLSHWGSSSNAGRPGHRRRRSRTV
jgi:histidine kinase/DNA gyrase B/HSP90-like ATPase